MVRYVAHKHTKVRQEIDSNLPEHRASSLCWFRDKQAMLDPHDMIK